jgi:hypothetical protein
MTKTTYPKERGGVITAMKKLFYDWLSIRPSNYPPNYFPRVLTMEGKVKQRDYLPFRAIKKEDYEKYSACDAKYVEIWWEFTPEGKQMQGERMFLDRRAISSKETHWSFGSCHSCWKLGRRNFTNAISSPHPMVAGHDDPNLARLGRCGCVCCNNCVRQIEDHQSNKKESYVHCPYCGNPECYSKN